MILRALRDGLRTALRRPGLVAFLWAWNLALALLVALPFSRWISGATALTPEADRLLDGINVGLVTELVTADPAVIASLLAATAAVILASLVSGALLSGGILALVIGRDDDPGAAAQRRSMLSVFFEGAGAFFGRFLRLLLVTVAAGLVATAAVAALLAVATRPLARGGSEPGTLVATLVLQAGVALTLAFFVLALDYARILVVLRHERRMLRAWFAGAWFVVRHPFGAGFIAVLAAAGVAATIAACSAFEVTVSARTWTLILVGIVLQQVMVFARTAVRVGQITAEASYCGRLQPAPPAPAPVVEASRFPVADALGSPFDDKAPDSPIREDEVTPDA